jgi:SAM-dependent methyltransferase
MRKGAAMMKRMPDKQSVNAKLAESKRPFSGSVILKDIDVSSMHRERAEKILADARELEEAKVLLSPFLEIGAGSVQRSSALINERVVDGVATDISMGSLKDAPFILNLLDYSRQPLRICCDAHYLPFLPNTFQFIFAYQTFHHFGNPVPVFEECYRVLGKNGHLFFNEEPMDTSLKRLLRGNRVFTQPPTRWQSLARKFRVHRFFWDDGALERSLGIIEARYDKWLWKRALQPFDETDLTVNRYLRLRTDLRRLSWANLLSGMVGGNVKGLCKKTSGERAPDDFRQRFMCLDCMSRIALKNSEEGLKCSACGRVYPSIEGIVRMLPAEFEENLD